MAPLSEPPYAADTWRWGGEPDDRPWEPTPLARQAADQARIRADVRSLVEHMTEPGEPDRWTNVRPRPSDWFVSNWEGGSSCLWIDNSGLEDLIAMLPPPRRRGPLHRLRRRLARIIDPET